MTPANTSTTRIEGLERWPGFVEGLGDIVVRGTQEWRIGDRLVHSYHNWIRDHIHMLKFARYFDPDPVSALQFILDNQHPSGFFYEILTSTTDGHASIVADEFRRILEKPVHCRWRRGRDFMGPQEGVLLRLELEADVEYLVVEGVARAWEATGDTAWMEGALPALVAGLEYSITHPDRYDRNFGLVKRPFTIDTWDFAWGQSRADRGIHPDTPMAIHYGDNAGVYAAARWLSDRLEKPRWRVLATGIRERTNQLCWNGRFYTHQVLLDPVETGGPPEREILSLSNTYAINRGFTDHQQAVSIIKEYLRVREETKDFSFAEWFTVYPPYPDFAGHRKWDYVNGGITPFVGGELATAAFDHGYEWYGADILDRLYRLWKRDGRLLFLYSTEGTAPENSWGPAGWGAAAVGQAILEGLAGVKMNVAEKTVTLTPRWAAAGENDVKVEAVYPSSGFGARYRYLHSPENRTVRMSLETAGSVSLSLLLPPRARAKRVTVDGSERDFRLLEVETSGYVSIEEPFEAAGRSREAVIEYQ